MNEAETEGKWKGEIKYIKLKERNGESGERKNLEVNVSNVKR